MKRLVYSPSVKAWVKSDSGVIDLSPYITDCKIERKVNDISTAEITFRNPRVLQDGKPRFMFTEKTKNDGTVGPVFHPMDPITIVLKRLDGKPVQVFTGYCDNVPYVQLFPGTAKITASCTLKRLLYTYWDPGLVFVRDFMKNYGWSLGGDGVVRRGSGDSYLTDTTKITNNQLNDSSIGNLVYVVLNEIGGWDPSNIFIEPLPENIGGIISQLFDQIVSDNKKVNADIAKVLQDIVGSGSFGTSGTGSGISNQTTGTVTIIGDSITYYSETAIQNAISNAQIFAQIGKHMKLDAGTTNGGDSGLKILKDNKNSLGDVVVIALGTNDEDVKNPSTFEGWIDQAMQIIGSTKTAVFVTVTNNDNVNNAIRNRVAKFNNLKIADWKSKAQLGPDGIHPTAHGQKVFAKTIADVVNSILPANPEATTGTAVYEGIRMASWIVPILKWARQHGWNGTIINGYRSYAKQKELHDAWIARGKTGLPAAAPGTSNHEGSEFPRGAVDVDEASAPELSRILLSGPYATTLVYAGDADVVHFSHPHNGGF
jgi:lysophospholipase L1-like esterase